MLLRLSVTASGVTDAPLSFADAKRQRRPRGSSSRQRSRCEFRTGSLNVGTLSWKGVEVVDMMERRRLEVLCVQETNWIGGRAMMTVGGRKLYMRVEMDEVVESAS